MVLAISLKFGSETSRGYLQHGLNRIPLKIVFRILHVLKCLNSGVSPRILQSLLSNK